MNRALIILLRDDKGSLSKSLEHCRSHQISADILIPSYSFEFSDEHDGCRVFRPMDLLNITDVDKAFSASFDWQKKLSDVSIKKNKKFSEFTIPTLKTPKLWAWAHVLAPHIFLHFRFVSLIKKAFQKHQYSHLAVHGDHQSFPWKKAFIENVYSELQSPPELLPTSESLQISDKYEKNLIEHTNARIQKQLRRRWKKVRRRVGLVFRPLYVSKRIYGALRKLVVHRKHYEKRLRRAYVSRKNKFIANSKIKWTYRLEKGQKFVPRLINALSNISVGSSANIEQLQGHPEKKNIIVIQSPHHAPWYFSHIRNQWVICDEYSEGIIEALVDTCNKDEYLIHIVYMSNRFEYNNEKIPYEKRYPGLVQEHFYLDFIKSSRFLQNLTTKLVFKQLVEFYKSENLRKHFKHENTVLHPIGLLPMLSSFKSIETNYIRHRRAWNRLIGEIKPSLIVGGRMEAWPYIVEIAKKKRIRTAGLKLGIAEELVPSLLKFRNEESIDTNHTCDLTFLWGDFEKNYINSAIPQFKDPLLPSGRARLDTFVNDSRFLNSDEIRNQLGYEGNDKVILFGGTITSRYGEFDRTLGGATFMGPQAYRRVIEKLSEIADGDENIKILVKPWGGDNLKLISEILERQPNSERFLLSTNKETQLHNIHYLKAVDLVVSNVSCLFGESVAVGTPVINLAIPEIKYLYGSNRLNAYGSISKNVDDINEMAEEIDRLFSDTQSYENLLTKSKENMQKIFGTLDGQIASRIASICLSENVQDSVNEIKKPALNSEPPLSNQFQ